MTSLVAYAFAVLGFAYVAGQSRITLRIRTVLARLMTVSREDREKRCGACGAPLLWWPSDNFGPPMSSCLRTGEHHRVHADGWWYPFQWPVLLIECPACLATWVGALVAWREPLLAAAVAPPGLAGVVPFAMLTCGLVAFLSFLAGIHGVKNV